MCGDRREVEGVGVDRQGVEVLRAAGQVFVQFGRFEPLFRLDRAVDQAAAPHQPAADGVLEILHLVAVGRPVQRMRVRHAEQRRRLAQALRVVPDPAVAVPVGMARRTGDPAPARHRRQRRAEQDLAAHPFRRLGRLAHLDLGQPSHGVRVVEADLEIERVVDVHRLAVRADAHGPRILADRDRTADALDFLVIVVDHLRQTFMSLVPA